MIYLPESYHFQDTPDFPNLKAIQVTAQEIGKSCKYFYASNLSPINKSVATDKFGELPEDSEKAREGVIQIGDYLHSTNPLFAICATFVAYVNGKATSRLREAL